MTALLEYLDLYFRELWKETLTAFCSIKCTVFILQYFGARIAHVINILENRPIMLAQGVANATQNLINFFIIIIYWLAKPTRGNTLMFITKSQDYLA